jgi:phosphoglycolate phosphatase-like HAD superfamily hydrolase
MRISFDLDGVLCVTPFGRLAVHAPDTLVTPLPDDFARFYESPPRNHVLRGMIEELRFGWRRPAHEAARTLHELRAAGHELLIVTGRSAQGEPLLRRWLRRHRLYDPIAEIRMAPVGLRPPQHKLAIAKMRAVDVHIDDDPRTVFYLARNGVPRIFLLDHAGALGGVALPSTTHAVRTLPEFATAIASRHSERA